MYCVFLHFFFFFKQKTAYEMRISDWSSDVCSSDLPFFRIPQAMHGTHPISVAPMMEWTDRHCRYFLRLISRHALLYTEMITTAAVLRGEIGRASCRERVCQYV